VRPVVERPRTLDAHVELFAARTPTLPPATHTVSYALGDREVVLVEPATPYEEERREWVAWARGLASRGRQVVAIVITHHHADHVGGAEFFERELGVEVWAHPETAARLPHLTITRHLADGETIALDGPSPRSLRVLHTPGHAPGHVCLHDEDAGTLVVGDMVASVGTILVGPEDGDMAEYLRQLRRLADRGARVALPAHGEPIETPTRLFEHYIGHRLMRERQVMGAVERQGEDGGDLDALVPLAYADTPRELWALARLSLEAHLVKLLREGRVQKKGRGYAASPSE
jgi:ribonuclease/clavin/mitogillin